MSRSDVMAELDPEIALVFLEEARGYLRTLEDPEVAAADKVVAAHSLKSAAGLVGLPEVRAAAEEAERLLRAREAEAATGSIVRAASLLRALADELERPSAVGGALGQDSGFDAEEARLLRSFFLDEAHEHLDGLTTTLQQLEREPGRRDLIDELLRKTHTLKGSAATVGLRAASEGAHRLEDLLVQLRSGRLRPGAEGFDALGAAVDTLRAIAGALDDAAAARDLLERLVRQLAEISRIAGLQLPAPREFTPTERGSGDGVPVELNPGSSGRIRIRRLSPTAPGVTSDSQSGPHPQAGDDHAAREGDEVALFDDRRGAGERRRDEPHILRVEASRVDTLMDAVGELVFDRTRLERRGQELRQVARELGKTRAALRMLLAPLRAAKASAEAGTAPTLEAISLLHGRVAELEADLAGDAAALARTTATLLDDTEALRRTSSQLQTGLTQVRMMSVRWLFSRLSRPLRDSARRAGKRIELHTAGDDTELDKTVVEHIADSMVQIVRNAVVHGIEPPHVRVRAGKPPVGRITMSARHQGDSVYLEIADDGAGIDVARVRKMLVTAGRMSESAAAHAKDERVIAAIFEPGISTREAADELAGRGVGLDVVRESIARLGGEIAVSSAPGEGTRFSIRLPLTTAITQALLFKVGGQVYALPNVHVIETTSIEASSPALPSHLRVRDEPVPLVSLHDLLGAEPPGDARRVPAVVLEFAGRRLAASCDKVVGPREIVVKSIGPLLAPLGIYAGATISGAGKVQLILDPAALAQLAYPTRVGTVDGVPAPLADGATSTMSNMAIGLPLAPAPALSDPGLPPGRVGRDTGGHAAIRAPGVSGQMAAVAPPRRILLADDSRAVRETVSRMLSAAGYIVDVAGDGWEAWEMLQDVSYDLLVTDLEMPRVGGFELIEKVRRGDATSGLPILVISSRAAEPHRLRASAAGANAFVAKPVSKPLIMEQVAALLR